MSRKSRVAVAAYEAGGVTRRMIIAPSLFLVGRWIRRFTCGYLDPSVHCTKSQLLDCSAAWRFIVIPALVAGIQRPTIARANGKMNPGDKHREDSLAR
jgi:hypothetical protein